MMPFEPNNATWYPREGEPRKPQPVGRLFKSLLVLMAVAALALVAFALIHELHPGAVTIWITSITFVLSLGYSAHTAHAVRKLNARAVKEARNAEPDLDGHPDR